MRCRSLLERLTENYQEQPPAPRKRGKQRDFSARSFLLLAAVAVTTRTWRDNELHRLLARDEALRQALGFPRVPDRRTIGRRLLGLVDEAAAQISALGLVIRAEVKPAPDQPEVSVIDGRMYQAAGPRWHKADRQAERVPAWLRNVDTESTWSRSGYRGWVQGYRLVVQGLAFPAPVPLWAAWRPNRENEAVIAEQALAGEHLQVTDVLLVQSQRTCC